MREKILNMIKEVSCLDDVSMDDSLDELELDSLETSAILGMCEYEFNIDLPIINFTYVSDIVLLVEKTISEKYDLC